MALNGTDSRYRRSALKHLGFGAGTVGLSLNGSAEKCEGGMPMAVTARMKILAQNYPDLQFSVNKISREMWCPNTRLAERLNKLAKYLIDRTRCGVTVRLASSREYNLAVYIFIYIRLYIHVHKWRLFGLPKDQ